MNRVVLAALVAAASWSGAGCGGNTVSPGAPGGAPGGSAGRTTGRATGGWPGTGGVPSATGGADGGQDAGPDAGHCGPFDLYPSCDGNYCLGSWAQVLAHPACVWYRINGDISSDAWEFRGDCGPYHIREVYWEQGVRKATYIYDISTRRQGRTCRRRKCRPG